MRRLFLLSALALVAPLAGCDETTDTRTDAEKVVGAWEGESLNARTTVGLSVPVLDLESGGDEASFTFADDDADGEGDFTFTFDPAAGRILSIPETDVEIALEQTVSFSGSYHLDDSDGHLHLESDDVPAGVTLEYDFSGDGDELEVIAEDPETLALLVGLATDEEAIELLATVVTGGSISFRAD